MSSVPGERSHTHTRARANVVLATSPLAATTVATTVAAAALAFRAVRRLADLYLTTHTFPPSHIPPPPRSLALDAVAAWAWAARGERGRQRLLEVREAAEALADVQRRRLLRLGVVGALAGRAAPDPPSLTLPAASGWSPSRREATDLGAKRDEGSPRALARADFREAVPAGDPVPPPPGGSADRPDVDDVRARTAAFLRSLGLAA